MSKILVNNIDNAYNSINAEIQDNIYDNNNQEITAAKVRQVLNEINTQTKNIELQLGTKKYRSTLYRNLGLSRSNEYNSQLKYDPDNSVLRIEVPIGSSLTGESTTGPQMNTMITTDDLSNFDYDALISDPSETFNLSNWINTEGIIYGKYSETFHNNWCDEDYGYFEINNSSTIKNIFTMVPNNQDTMQCMDIYLEDDNDTTFSYHTDWDFVPEFSSETPYKEILYDNDLTRKVMNNYDSILDVSNEVSITSYGQGIDFSTQIQISKVQAVWSNSRQQWQFLGANYITSYISIEPYSEIEFTINRMKWIGLFNNTPFQQGEPFALEENPIYNHNSNDYIIELYWNDTEKTGTYKFINTSQSTLYLCWQSRRVPANYIPEKLIKNGIVVIEDSAYKDIPLVQYQQTLTQRLMKYISEINKVIQDNL